MGPSTIFWDEGRCFIMYGRRSTAGHVRLGFDGLVGLVAGEGIDGRPGN